MLGSLGPGPPQKKMKIGPGPERGPCWSNPPTLLAKAELSRVFLFLFISGTSQLKHQFVVIVVVPELRVLRRGCQQGPLEPSMQGLSNLSMQPRRAGICR